MCEKHNHDAPTQAQTLEQDHAPAHDHGHGHSHGHAPADAGAAGSADSDVAECPVMRGSYVEKAEAESQGLVREYDGTTYYLCCAACGPLFDASPEKYVSAL